MYSPKKPTEQSLIEALRQNWLQAQHLENERTSFTNVYAVVVAGVLAFLGQANVDKRPFFFLYLFMLLFSILGLFVTLKTNHEYGNQMSSLKNTIEKLHLTDQIGYPTAYNERNSIWKIIRIRYVFSLFYILTAVMWIIILVLIYQY